MQSLKDYFHIFRSDQRAILALLVIIFTLCIIYLLVRPSFKATTVSDEDNSKSFQLFVNETQQLIDEYPPRLDVGETININRADTTQLKRIPNIGSAMALRIVEYRTLNGAFNTADELMNVKGIGESLYEEIAPHIRTEEVDED